MEKGFGLHFALLICLIFVSCYSEGTNEKSADKVELSNGHGRARLSESPAKERGESVGSSNLAVSTEKKIEILRAAQNEKWNIVRAYIDNGGDVAIKDPTCKTDGTLLHIAARFGQDEIIKRY